MKFEGKSKSDSEVKSGLEVAGQLLEGDFTFEKNSEGDVKLRINGLKMNMGNTVSINNVSGEFEIDSQGISGVIGIKGFAVKSDKINFDTDFARFEVNTRASQFTGDYDLKTG